MTSTAERAALETSKATVSKLILPASSFERSRKSSTTIIIALAEDQIMSRWARADSGRPWSSRSSSEKPTTPCSGVLNSWLNTAKNSDRRLVASSAASFAFFSSSSAFFRLSMSIQLISTTSVPLHGSTTTRPSTANHRVDLLPSTRHRTSASVAVLADNRPPASSAHTAAPCSPSTNRAASASRSPTAAPNADSARAFCCTTWPSRVTSSTPIGWCRNSSTPRCLYGSISFRGTAGPSAKIASRPSRIRTPVIVSRIVSTSSSFG
mmetsp:Transcript_7375/g.22461  ORF Transcript_7375/g.22461 Transcript_7375/m.22461 type:complete len:266 (-) Transcript_7375:309-1106(-)